MFGFGPRRDGPASISNGEHSSRDREATRMLRLSGMALAIGIVMAGCADDGDPGSDGLAVGEAASSAEPAPEVQAELDPEPGSDTDSDPEPADARRARYVDAVSEMFEGVPSRLVDVSCLSAGIVDRIGMEELEAAGVDPTDLVTADNLEEAGIRITFGIQTGVTAAFEDCVDGVALAEQVVPSLDLGFPAEVTDCMAESMDDLVTRSVASEFIDGSGGLSAGNVGEAVRIGADCAAGLVAGAPGSAVSWAEGPEAFQAALVLRMTTPVFDGAIATPEDEGVCFGAAVVAILGPLLADVPSTTVGDLVVFLAGSLTPDELGIGLDDSVAVRLAEANVGCIDNNATMARTTLAGLDALVEVDETARQRLEGCFDETIDDSIWIENLRLQYLHGPGIFDRPEALPLFELLAQAGEGCSTRLLEAPGVS